MIASASATGSSGGTRKRIHIMPRNLAAARHVGRDDRPAESRRFEQAFRQPFPARRQAPRYAPAPRRSGCPRHDPAISRPGLCLPAFDLPLRNRGRIGRIAVARNQEPHLLAVGAHQFVRGDQRTHALVVEQSTDKGGCDFARRLRQAASGARCRRPIPGSDARDLHRRRSQRAQRGHPDFAPAPPNADCSAAPASAPASTGRNSPRKRLLEVNTKPSPASALTRVTGSPARRERSDHRRLQRHMMRDIGIEISVQIAHLPHDRDHVNRIEAAALPVERMQREALRLDAALRPCRRGSRHARHSPHACAASAIGSRCDRKYQSSVTR